MQNKNFDSLLSNAIDQYRKSSEIQEFVLNNMRHYTYALINFKALNDFNVKFDFREDYWYKTEYRFFVKFCEVYFDKTFFPPKDLREELFMLAQDLKKSRAEGAIQTLPAVGAIELKKDFIQYGETIANAMRSTQKENFESDVVSQHRKLKHFKNLKEAFIEFCDTFPKENEAKKLNGILKVRFRFLPFTTAKSLEELKTHAKYFSALYGLYTNTNSYKVGGAQFFGPVLGNSNFEDLHQIYQAWSDGKSIKEVPFLSHNSVSKNKADFSNTTPVLEVYSYCKLDKYPIINNTSFKEYQKYLSLDESNKLKAFKTISEEIYSHFDSSVSDEDRLFLEQTFNDNFDKSIKNFRMGVQPERLKNQTLKNKYYPQSLTKALEDDFNKIAQEVSVPNDFDKSLAMFHLLIDSCLYIDKEPKEKTIKKNLFTKSGGKKYWIYAPGEQAVMWDEFFDKGIMALGWSEMGDLTALHGKDDLDKMYDKTYTPEGEAYNNKRALWEFANSINVGDIVLVKKGTRALLGYGIVTSDYTHDPSMERFSHVRKVDWKVNKAVELPDSDQRLVLKTLTDLTKYGNYPLELLSYFDFEQPTESNPIENEEELELEGTHEEYGVNEALEDLFLEKEELENIKKSLEDKKNIILQGPPGVGKTFMAKKIAKIVMGFDDDSKIDVVQFHQSYSYEDFVQGYRPDGNGGFVIKNGLFYELCSKAKNNPESNYFLVIDEINRGNLSKIFGELLMLIEADKRGLSHQVSLTYSDSGEKFYIPDNIYLIGTMNTADRSISIIDYALRRRFRFINLRPQYDNPKYKEYLKEKGVDEVVIDKIINTMKKINQKIREDKRRLGSGYEIGHSYFCPTGKEEYGEEWFRFVMDMEIVPLLKEYWFDDEKALEFLSDEWAA